MGLPRARLRSRIVSTAQAVSRPRSGSGVTIEHSFQMHWPSTQPQLPVGRYGSISQVVNKDSAASRDYGFSYRSFARAAGFSSPNYLKLVIDGQRNLTAEMAARFAQACGLLGSAADYFCTLVAFNQARSAPEQDR